MPQGQLSQEGGVGEWEGRELPVPQPRVSGCCHLLAEALGGLLAFLGLSFHIC